MTCPLCVGGFTRIAKFRNGYGFVRAVIHTGPHLDGPDGQPLDRMQLWESMFVRRVPDFSWGADIAGLRHYLRRRIIDPNADLHAERRRKIASAVAQLLPAHDALLTFTHGPHPIDLIDFLTLRDYSTDAAAPDATTWFGWFGQSPLRPHLDEHERTWAMQFLCYSSSDPP